jgi:hypothetical protein
MRILRSTRCLEAAVFFSGSPQVLMWLSALNILLVSFEAPRSAEIVLIANPSIVVPSWAFHLRRR